VLAIDAGITHAGTLRASVSSDRRAQEVFAGEVTGLGIRQAKHVRNLGSNPVAPNFPPKAAFGLADDGLFS
jgi:hypothetical protein